MRTGNIPRRFEIVVRLTPAQSKAIRQYAAAHGRKWKSELRESWMSGIYYEADDSASLQQIRNSFGPSWLIKCDLREEAL